MRIKQWIAAAAIVTAFTASAREYVYSDVFDTTFKSAYLVGESADKARDIPASIPWSVVYNDETKTGVYSIDLSDYNVVGMVPQVCADGTYTNLTKNADTGRYECTFNDKELGGAVAISHYIAYAGGLVQQLTPYTEWGMESEASAATLKLTAAAEDVTTNSAKIVYTVETPEATTDYTVYYKLGDAAAVAATASPIELTGLAEKTDYTCEVYAVAGELESDHVTVTFKTKSSTARDYVYDDLLPVEFKNAFLAGETEADRRSIRVNLPWSVVYNDGDQTAVYSIDLGDINVVGLVPQIWSDNAPGNFVTLALNAETGRYEYTFTGKELDANVAISHYIAYDGGVIDIRSSYTQWGQENEMPVVGEATELNLSAASNTTVIEKPVALYSYFKDAQGYYADGGQITYTSTNKYDEFEDNTLNPLHEKGTRTITATCGDMTSSTEIAVMGCKEATDLAAGLTGYTDTENVIAGSVNDVTSGDRDSYIEWNCDENDPATHAHYLILDLEKEDGYYIEGVEVYFEGANASKFTVTLSNTAPAEISGGIAAQDMALEDKVWENEETNAREHYFFQEPTASHRYVALRTTEAANPQWNIKLQDFKVFGSVNSPSTGIGNVAVELDDQNAPVEYYNLQGQRIQNPAAGQLVIRRQGSTVTKTVIR